MLDKTTFGKISINRGEIKVVKDESPSDESSQPQPPPSSTAPATPIKTSAKLGGKKDITKEDSVADSNQGGRATTVHVNTAPTELSMFLDEFGLSNLYASIEKVNSRLHGH